jgi:SAM-dependent methyltransferase
MPNKGETDYVLGTHDEEVARLGLQHRVWRPVASDCWRRAGITTGSRVLDVGAGPGYATIDLAEIVGPTGEVHAIERSARFLEVARCRCAERGLSQVRFREADVVEEEIGPLNVDFAWCRWVASFVSSPARLIANIGGAVRAGGVAMFHEYSHYETFQFAPRRPALEEFSEKVMTSWRAAGGLPNVGVELPALLHDAGFEIIEAHPRVVTISPKSYVWQWPASFIEINLARLRELGHATEEWTDSVRREFMEAETDPRTLFTTPLFLEIIARRR